MNAFGSKLPFRAPDTVVVPKHLEKLAKSIITPKKKYWVFIEVWECPVCGDGETFRERRYTPRPEKWEDRHKYVRHYDYCNI